MTDWRISNINGVLLACYFIPTWTIAAFKIALSPVRGLYDRANIAPAMYVSDHLASSALQVVRFAWLIALSKFIVAAFFLLFLLLMMRDAWSRTASAGEALGYALVSGCLVSFAGMMAASAVGEIEALRLHATEVLMLIGASVILLVESGMAKTDQPGQTSSRRIILDHHR